MSLPNQPTVFDLINAGNYAQRRIIKDKCEAPETQQKFPGVGWVVDKRGRDFTCPIGLDGCEELAGHCKFLTEDACLAQSGDYREQGTGKKPYLEWRADETGAVGSGGEKIGKCIFGNFALRKYCEDPHSRKPGQFVPGVTNVPPFRYDASRGRCLMTKPYCKYMGVGFTERNDDYYKKTGIDIPDCHLSWLDKHSGQIFGSQVVFKGVKRGLLQKFMIDASKDAARGVASAVTAGYEGGDWPPFHKFAKDAASGKFNNDLGIGADYSGQPDEEGFEKEKIKSQIFEGFEQIKKEFFSNATEAPASEESVDIPCDEKAVVSKKLVMKDCAGPGVNLYLITWSAEFIRDNPSRNLAEFGFICSELKSLGLKPNKNVIHLEKADTMGSKGLRRVYFISKNPELILNLFGNIALKMGAVKKFMGGAQSQ